MNIKQLYQNFAGEHPDTEDVVYRANEIAFTEGFKVAASLLLEGKGDAPREALDQKWCDFELDTAADLEGVIYIASALCDKLNEDCEDGKCSKEHTSFAFGLLRALQGIDASRAARVDAIAKARLQIIKGEA